MTKRSNEYGDYTPGPLHEGNGGYTPDELLKLEI